MRFGTSPHLVPFLRFVKPAIVAIVGQALVRLSRSAIRSPLLATVGLASLAAALLGVHELVVLAVAGLVAALPSLRREARPLPALALLPWSAAGAPAPTASGLFLVFLKIGSVLFGSGYVLLAFLQSELVERRGWLTGAQLLDAVAAGQVTPGPVFSTATFVGYLLAGPAGAFLDGVNVASVGLMASVAWILGRGSVTDVPTALVLLVAASILLATRVSATWLVAGALVLGGAAAVIG